MLNNVFKRCIFRKHFIDEERNQAITEGEVHKRESLADTLRILAEQGSDVFYKGYLGRQIIDELQQMGSKMTMQDLFEYKYVILSVIQIR
jgi:gamma-glutamyltranspeptidase